MAAGPATATTWVSLTITEVGVVEPPGRVAVHFALPVAVSTATSSVQAWPLPGLAWNSTAPTPPVSTVDDIAHGTAPATGGATVHRTLPPVAL